MAAKMLLLQFAFVVIVLAIFPTTVHCTGRLEQLKGCYDGVQCRGLRHYVSCETQANGEILFSHLRQHCPYRTVCKVGQGCKPMFGGQEAAQLNTNQQEEPEKQQQQKEQEAPNGQRQVQFAVPAVAKVNYMPVVPALPAVPAVQAVPMGVAHYNPYPMGSSQMNFNYIMPSQKSNPYGPYQAVGYNNPQNPSNYVHLNEDGNPQQQQQPHPENPQQSGHGNGHHHHQQLETNYPQGQLIDNGGLTAGNHRHPEPNAMAEPEYDNEPKPEDQEENKELNTNSDEKDLKQSLTGAINQELENDDQQTKHSNDDDDQQTGNTGHQENEECENDQEQQLDDDVELVKRPAYDQEPEILIRPGKKPYKKPHNHETANDQELQDFEKPERRPSHHQHKQPENRPEYYDQEDEIEPEVKPVRKPSKRPHHHHKKPKPSKLVDKRPQKNDEEPANRPDYDQKQDTEIIVGKVSTSSAGKHHRGDDDDLEEVSKYNLDGHALQEQKVWTPISRFPQGGLISSNMEYQTSMKHNHVVAIH